MTFQSLLGVEGKEKGVGSRIFLVIDAEEGLAIFTIFLVLVDEFIQGVKVGRSRAINVVPPVANKVLLVENRAVGTQKRVVVTIRLAHVENLEN